MRREAALQGMRGLRDHEAGSQRRDASDKHVLLVPSRVRVRQQFRRETEAGSARKRVSSLQRPHARRVPQS